VLTNYTKTQILIKNVPDVIESGDRPHGIPGECLVGEKGGVRHIAMLRHCNVDRLG
jgi:hypothetical protein